MNREKVTKSVLIATFAALIAVGAFIKIPLPPVPITLQTLFALIAALTLPLSISLPSVLVYLFLGAIGLPIFTSGGGLAALTGPTGGYLIGLIPAVIVGSIISKINKKNSFILYLVAALVATVFIYIPGLYHLGASRGFTLAQTFQYGLIPFIIGDTIKMIISALTAYKLKEQAYKIIFDKDR